MRIFERIQWKASSNKKLGGAILLSIVIPVSLLISFRLTGVLPEVVTPETVTVETVSWKMEMPITKVDPNERIESSYNDGTISAALNVHIQMYFEDSVGLYHGLDIIVMSQLVSINVTRGFIDSVIVNFPQISDNAIVNIIEDSNWMRMYNLKIEKIHDSAGEAYFKSYGVNQPKSCKLEIVEYWVFLDKNNLDQNLTVTLETTYFNGESWQRIIIPIQLKVYIP